MVMGVWEGGGYSLMVDRKAESEEGTGEGRRRLSIILKGTPPVTYFLLTRP
jgi:hypothetical protein